MAAGGFKEFVAGETLDQDEINDYLMQGVLVFAGTAARGSAITSPVEGQFAFLKDEDALTFYDGTQWAELSTTPGAAVISGTTGSPSVASSTVIGGTAYDVYTFTGDGSITVSEAGFADFLVVGGGAGGGVGGGGAGGYHERFNWYAAADTYTVTVGAGGPGSDASSPVGNGASSRLGQNNGIGGGVGDANGGSTVLGLPGGSGGGGRNNAGASTVDPTQGNAGGNSSSSGVGGGGGGASAAGGADGGAGGAGKTSTIDGTSTGRAGGGGGGPSGSASDGGGAARAGNGTANTGGGGGGDATDGLGGNGGSGIVIVRVAV